MTKPTDPLSDLINAAVAAAVAEHVAPLIAGLASRPAQPEPLMAVQMGGERFVSMVEMVQRLGVNRSTLLRRERAGKLPKRKTFPDGRVGWTASQIDAWFKQAVEGTDPERNAARAARISH